MGINLIPAIDLRGGKIVRLIGGSFDKEIVYGNDPVAFAKNFENQGAKWLHVVDLDGAFEGILRNIDGLRKIRSNTKLKIQFGGGLRSHDDIERVLSEGVDRIILGTKGLEKDFLADILSKYGGKVGISLDAHQGIVQVRGWTVPTQLSVEAFIEKLKNLKVGCLIYTNIAKDGSLGGPDLKGFQDILESTGSVDVILSGGVSSLDDLREVAAIKNKNFRGVIVGRALYENRFSVSDAIRTLREAK